MMKNTFDSLKIFLHKRKKEKKKIFITILTIFFSLLVMNFLYITSQQYSIQQITEQVSNVPTDYCLELEQGYSSEFLYDKIITQEDDLRLESYFMSSNIELDSYISNESSYSWNSTNIQNYNSVHNTSYFFGFNEKIDQGVFQSRYSNIINLSTDPSQLERGQYLIDKRTAEFNNISINDVIYIHTLYAEVNDSKIMLYNSSLKVQIVGYFELLEYADLRLSLIHDEFDYDPDELLLLTDYDNLNLEMESFLFNINNFTVVDNKSIISSYFINFNFNHESLIDFDRDQMLISTLNLQTNIFLPISNYVSSEKEYFTLAIKTSSINPSRNAMMFAIIGIPAVILLFYLDNWISKILFKHTASNLKLLQARGIDIKKVKKFMQFENSLDGSISGVIFFAVILAIKALLFLMSVTSDGSIILNNLRENFKWIYYMLSFIINIDNFQDYIILLIMNIGGGVLLSNLINQSSYKIYDNWININNLNPVRESIIKEDSLIKIQIARKNRKMWNILSIKKNNSLVYIFLVFLLIVYVVPIIPSRSIVFFSLEIIFSIFSFPLISILPIILLLFIQVVCLRNKEEISKFLIKIASKLKKVSYEYSLKQFANKFDDLFKIIFVLSIGFSYINLYSSLSTSEQFYRENVAYIFDAGGERVDLTFNTPVNNSEMEKMFQNSSSIKDVNYLWFSERSTLSLSTGRQIKQFQFYETNYEYFGLIHGVSIPVDKFWDNLNFSRRSFLGKDPTAIYNSFLEKPNGILLPEIMRNYGYSISDTITVLDEYSEENDVLYCEIIGFFKGFPLISSLGTPYFIINHESFSNQLMDSYSFSFFSYEQYDGINEGNETESITYLINLIEQEKNVDIEIEYPTLNLNNQQASLFFSNDAVDFFFNLERSIMIGIISIGYSIFLSTYVNQNIHIFSLLKSRGVKMKDIMAIQKFQIIILNFLGVLLGLIGFLGVPLFHMSIGNLLYDFTGVKRRFSVDFSQLMKYYAIFFVTIITWTIIWISISKQKISRKRKLNRLIRQEQ